MKLDRLLSIVILLLGRESVTAAELSRRFELSVRTIYRDLDAINEAGIPVVASPGPGGGFGIDPAYTIDRRLLGFEDLRAIISALKGLNMALEDGAIGSALEKITSLAPRGRASEFLEDRVVIDLFPWGARKEERELVKRLEPAIAERRVVSFTYSSYGKAKEKRVVEPMTLVFKAYAWYLWAWCRLRGDYRLFRLSRMRSLELSLERFKRRSAAYPRALEAPSGGLRKVVLRFDAPSSARAEEWFGSEGSQAREGGDLGVVLQVPEGNWIVQTLLGFGPGVEVLEPPELRAELAKAASLLAAANSGCSPRS